MFVSEFYTRKKLEETMHVHVRLLSQDSTFDLSNFFPKFFSKIWVAKLGVGLICECGLYAGVYGNRKQTHNSLIANWFAVFEYSKAH